jgi:hypothetical protein
MHGILTGVLAAQLQSELHGAEVRVRLSISVVLWR